LIIPPLSKLPLQTVTAHAAGIIAQCTKGTKLKFSTGVFVEYEAMLTWVL
jgi:hypothetical protein